MRREWIARRFGRDKYEARRGVIKEGKTDWGTYLAIW